MATKTTKAPAKAAKTPKVKESVSKDEEIKMKPTKKPSKAKAERALVIVESPAKSKTIKKILGDSYTIEASYGHIRDFPKSVLGFDVQKDFEPSFVVIPDKKKVVTR